MVSLIRMVRQCLIPLLILAITTRVHSQLDSNGFLSIDCGLPPNSTYVETNRLTYVSDDQFIKTGINSNISSSIIAEYGDRMFKEYLTVRYFPTGVRNCYTIRSLTVGFKYLIRANFFYGDYDNLDKPPIFDIYLGVNFWNTVNASSLSVFPEIIVTVTADYLQVCLVNKGQGIPFISSLHLREFETGMYPYGNSTTSLILLQRANLGGNKFVTRYPNDIYDRWWHNDTFDRAWTKISTSTNISYSEPVFEAPSFVMQTAVTTSSVQVPLIINWRSNKRTKYYFILYFYEIQTQLTGVREFDVFINGARAFTEPIILHSWAWSAHWWSGFTEYNVSVEATSNSTLPPLLNAFEVYTVAPVEVLSTYDKDVAAINSIKEYHKINKEWSGDPCFPTQFLWTGIDCTTVSSNITRITSLNLSSSLLTGPLSQSFGSLTALEYLYLSNNNLSGSLPSSLDNLIALKLMDIRGNPDISTTLPPVLDSKRQNGNLDYRFGEAIPSPPPPPPPSPPSAKNNVIIIAIAVGAPLLIIAIAIAIVFGLKKRKHKQATEAKQNESFEPSPLPNDTRGKNYENILQAENTSGKPHSKGAEQIFPKFENRKFSYNDLRKITNDFERNIGTGGFGSVYFGHVENGVQVAVKILSQSSTQGFTEFLAEAENLARVHHKNLVFLMGYCIDKNCMALVYEYMQEGNLRDKLKDNAMPLTWKQRLQIAYGSALGLEYLHKACNPPIIHRDVKTSNILLNANLEAKIADFGLSRAFENDAISHVSTRVLGTLGYLDPEYYLSNHLSAKSDVYSFGVVLLEIVTGLSPTGTGIEGGNLIQWVHRKLSGGDIESIVDPRIQDKYDINSVWKAADLARKCTERTSSRRPTMSVVVAELKESLDLEMSTEEIHIERSDNLLTDISQNSNIEMAHMGGTSMLGPSVR